MGNLLEQLKGIKESHLHGELNNGICSMLYTWNGVDTKEQFIKLCKGWPRYSGVALFPVPCPYYGGNLIAPRWAFYNLHKWQGVYGDCRVKLLDWCIATLERKEARRAEELRVLKFAIIPLIVLTGWVLCR